MPDTIYNVTFAKNKDSVAETRRVSATSPSAAVKLVEDFGYVVIQATWEEVSERFGNIRQTYEPGH